MLNHEEDSDPAPRPKILILQNYTDPSDSDSGSSVHKSDGVRCVPVSAPFFSGSYVSDH